MKDYENDFVDNLIFYRNQKGLSQLELSGICDCGKSTIGGIESRKHFPSFELILKLAYALEIHPADLFLRNASRQREEVRHFFEKDIMEMVEERFPIVPKYEDQPHLQQSSK
ncbi:MAG: helix-turn-helix transcriptional regulator [Treponema sp.]|uniref:helix-turn-helix domain-containing protein n=1 Tax=Treponema sp. TaxID=166 RepID=UPI002A909D13|nr:helix-turn-helix transcriptional regulator [Treponema sp.]MDY6398154.1 helix-turn-helix transcriptional regulator [Treponema sp.]